MAIVNPKLLFYRRVRDESPLKEIVGSLLCIMEFSKSSFKIQAVILGLLLFSCLILWIWVEHDYN